MKHTSLRVLLLATLAFTATVLSATDVVTNPYTFKGSKDGANPRSGVIIDAAGNLYGTTTSCFFSTKTIENDVAQALAIAATKFVNSF